MPSTPDSALTLRIVSEILINENLDNAKEVLRTSYPFVAQPVQSRNYSELEKTRVFVRDGFIDRYTGKRLVYIGMLRLLSHYMPDEFPFHPNWKSDSCHPAYWELTPTLDHIVPIARGGTDAPKNWITTSMLSNALKANWTLEELGQKIRPAGNLAEWDGLTCAFTTLVESDETLFQQKHIKGYYRLIKAALDALK